MHIAHKAEDTDDVRYLNNKTGLFEALTVDAQQNVGNWLSMALNSAGHVYIAYQDKTSADLKLALNLSGTFLAYDIDTYGNVGQHTAIGVTPGKEVVIVYYAAAQTGLKSSVVTVVNTEDQNCDGF